MVGAPAADRVRPPRERTTRRYLAGRYRRAL